MLKHFLPVNRLDPLFEMEINQKEKKYKEFPNMFNIIEPNDPIDLISEKIDPLTNIIISTNEENIIKRNPEGSISIMSNRKLDISNSRNFNQIFAIVDYIPKVKFIIPKGIKLKMEIPEASPYCHKLYKEFRMVKRSETAENVPGYIIYHDIKFTLHINMQRMRERLATLNLKKGESLCDVNFHPIYHVGSHDFAFLENIYWIKNEEVFKRITDIF